MNRLRSDLDGSRTADADDLETHIEPLHRFVIDRSLTLPDDNGPFREELRRRAPLLASSAAAAVIARVTDRVRGLGPLATLLEDDEVSDVLVNGPGPVWVDRRGALTETGIHLDAAEIRRIVERIAAPTGRRVDLHQPIADLRLADGSRAHVVLPPVAVDGPTVTIRRFRQQAVALSEFGAAPVEVLLTHAIVGRRNIVVSGGTGSGKTTLLNALCALLPRHDRTVTIEDTAELRVAGAQSVALQSRPATVDGLAAVSIGDLVRASLRMRPDRILVGEVRGPECLDMLWAMNTGHPGSMTTIHANGPADAIRRLETMALSSRVGLDGAAVRERIHAAVDLIVHVGRATDGRRGIEHLAEPALDAAADPALRHLDLDAPGSLERPTRARS